MPFAAMALSMAAAPGAARAAAWADGDPYLAYGYQNYVIVVDTDGNQLYTITPTQNSNFDPDHICGGTVAAPEPLNPTSKDIVIKGHMGGMARYTVGLASATELWVNNFSETTNGCGMADSMVWGPDGKIYRQHQWGADAGQTVDTYDPSNGNVLLSDILGGNPGGGTAPPSSAHILVGGICFGLPGEADLANRLYVSWHTRPAAPTDWGLVVAEFVNSSPADLSGTWSEQMYDENGVRDAGGTHHFMESADASGTEAWEILSMQWGYYGGQPALFAVGKNDQTAKYVPETSAGWGGMYVFGADNVDVAPDNWMDVGQVAQCTGMQLGARTGIDDRVAYVLHASGGGDGLQRWNMDDTDGNPLVSTFAAHGVGMASGVNIIGPVSIVLTVSIAATNPNAQEPSLAGTFTVTRTGPTADPLPVDLAITGTATKTADYTASPDVIATNQVTIPGGSDSVDITITPVDDGLPESDETVVITVVAGAGYGVGTPSSATVTIADATKPGPFVLLSPVDGATNVVNTPTLSWQAAARATEYYVIVATDPGLTARIVDDTVANTQTDYDLSSAGLLYETQYYWKITAHNNIGDTDPTVSPFDFCWTEPGPPTVTRTTPGNGKDDVPVSTVVRITFSEPMQPGTENAVSLSAGGDDFPGDATLSSDGMLATFTPTGDLAEETVYTIRVAGTAQDLGGTAIGSDYTSSFTTQLALVGFAKGDGCVPGVAGTAAALMTLGLAAAALLRQRR
jgi:hypothetical protein